MDDARELLTTRLGARPLHRILGGGYTLMEHWLVELEDGTRAFAKVAVDEPTAGFLRDENRVYSAVEAPFLPRLMRWDDDGALPILVLEDLTGAHWPPPWRPRPGDVELVREALDELHAMPPPNALAPLMPDDLHTWREVERDPEPFLGLGLCSAEWLEQALPALIAATDRSDIGGDAFVHLDVRSDNICIAAGQAKLVDWNWASVGNPLVDLAFWLPSLYVEGGPQPSEVLPDAGDVTAVVSGFFAPIAGLPPPAGAPAVRPLQLAQLKVALPWAVEVLGLPPLDA
jgi:Phosphotransferase enzyme family